MNEEAEQGEGKGRTEGAKEGGREVGEGERKGEEKGWPVPCVQAHMSLQTPLNAAHQGSESSIDVTRGSVHFWKEGKDTAGSRQGPDILPYSSQASLSLAGAHTDSPHLTPGFLPPTWIASRPVQPQALTDCGVPPLPEPSVFRLI